MARRPAGQTLAQLIIDRKGDRSFEQIAKDCGGVPASRRIQQLASRPIKNFPDPDTIVHLARGLAVTPGDIVSAAARSLGVPVSNDDPASLTIPGAGELPPMAREALLYAGRAFVAMQNSAGQIGGQTSGNVVPLPLHQTPLSQAELDLAAFEPEDPEDGQNP